MSVIAVWAQFAGLVAGCQSQRLAEQLELLLMPAAAVLVANGQCCRVGVCWVEWIGWAGE